MQGLLSERVKITKVLDYTGAGTSATNTSSVDMAGYDGVVFITSFGTAAANNVMKAQQSSTIEGCWAIQYGAQSIAVSNKTTGTIYGEAFVSPAEGTA